MTESESMPHSTGRRTAREKNKAAGGEAAEMLAKLHDHETGSYGLFLQIMAQKIGVSTETVRNYATGKSKIPEKNQPDVLKSARSFLWRVDNNWKLATAVSEELGINAQSFGGVDDFIEKKEPTQFRLIRLDRKRELVDGSVTIFPDGKLPRMWQYTYTTTNSITREVQPKVFSGPLWSFNKMLCAICAGGREEGVERHLRVEFVWPSSDPRVHESYGISLSSFIREGHPVAAPFVLAPLKRGEELLSNRDARESLRIALEGMTRGGMIHLALGWQGSSAPPS